MDINHLPRSMSRWGRYASTARATRVLSSAFCFATCLCHSKRDGVTSAGGRRGGVEGVRSKVGVKGVKGGSKKNTERADGRRIRGERVIG